MSSSTPTEVGDRLERLAERAPRRLDDPELLWSRGRRRQRGRWAATAAGLAVVAALGAVAASSVIEGTQDRQGMVAASPDGDLLLPDLVRQPGEWEPAFPSAPGRLVAVGIGTKGGWWSSRNAWWGVSGETGKSRFLDLPDAVTATDAAPVLSADGRRLAYWFTGETSEEPFRREDSSPAVGVAVLDLETGDVSRWSTDTARGLMTDGLAWAGDVLWWSGGPYNKGSTTSQWSAEMGVHTWDLTTDVRRDLPRGTPGAGIEVGLAGAGPDGFVAPGRGRQPGLRLARGDVVGRTVRLDERLEHQTRSGPALSPGGTELVGLRQLEDDTGGAPLPLVVADVNAVKITLDAVDDITTTAVHGWRSDDEVVIETYTGGDMDRVYGASVVDVDTGEVTHLLDFRGNVPRFAYDAWSAEVVEAPDAPWAPDPRLVALTVLVVGWIALKAAQVVRRRRVGS